MNGQCRLSALPRNDPRASTCLECQTCSAVVPIESMTAVPGKCPPRLYLV
jgi:hypothetical protein